MEKFYGNYITGVNANAVRAKFASMSVTDEAAITVAISIAERAADEAYWVGVDEGRERGFNSGVSWACSDDTDFYEK